MPVFKYRDVSEMPDGIWHEKGSTDLFRAIRRTWDLARRTTPLRFPSGVYKHHSIADADKLREVWEEANFRAHVERRPAGALPAGSGLRSVVARGEEVEALVTHDVPTPSKPRRLLP